MCLWFKAKIFWGPGAEKGTSTWEWALDLKAHLEIRKEGGRGSQQRNKEHRITEHETLVSVYETKFL